MVRTNGQRAGDSVATTLLRSAVVGGETVVYIVALGKGAHLTGDRIPKFSNVAPRTLGTIMLSYNIITGNKGYNYCIFHLLFNSCPINNRTS